MEISLLATEHVGVDQFTATKALMLMAFIEIFVRPSAGYLWTKDFARKIGLLGIAGFFHGLLGALNVIAGLFLSTEKQFQIYSLILPVGMTDDRTDSYIINFFSK